ncbi:MAG: hypothetical protein ABI068_04735 [Ktedonobacterales bacterium]
MLRPFKAERVSPAIKAERVSPALKAERAPQYAAISPAAVG